MAELEQDEKLADLARKREREQEQNVRRYHKAAYPVLEALCDAGFEVHTIGELLTKGRYKAAIPILIQWLPKVTDTYVKQDIVRTLSVPWGKDAAAVLIAEFLRADDAQGTGLRWALANALEVVADDSIFAEIVDLVRSKQYGHDREMLALALAKMKTPKAVDVLVDLLADEEVAGHALAALVKLKAKIPRELVEPFLEHPQAWVRKEARKLLEHCR